MNRTLRAQLAQETVQICEEGKYQCATGAKVSIREELESAKRGTVVYEEATAFPPLIISSRPPVELSARNETAFAALARLAASAGHLACLNFASAKNPGGGFLNGAIAQEEALAAASGLYPCLLTAPSYYERNRAHRSALYLDLAIFSPGVPFFRDDTGRLLERPIVASVITSPAPNAGAVAQNEPGKSALIAPTLRRRAERVLNIAAAQRVEQLVLGAWGCGVFRNDPRLVARVFGELLKPPGKFATAFRTVVFAVFDRSQPAVTLEAFAEEFNR